MSQFDIRHVKIQPITLLWSDWHTWDKLTIDARTNASAITPPSSSGVYEARLHGQDERLTIGKAANLRRRVKQGLVKGKSPHSAGKDIRALEDTSRILIRWAETDRPAAVEEDLHRRYKEVFGRLPKYTDRT